MILPSTQLRRHVPLSACFALAPEGVAAQFTVNGLATVFEPQTGEYRLDGTGNLTVTATSAITSTGGLAKTGPAR